MRSSLHRYRPRAWRPPRLTAARALALWLALAVAFILSAWTGQASGQLVDSTGFEPDTTAVDPGLVYLTALGRLATALPDSSWVDLQLVLDHARREAHVRGWMQGTQLRWVEGTDGEWHLLELPALEHVPVRPDSVVARSIRLHGVLASMFPEDRLRLRDQLEGIAAAGRPTFTDGACNVWPLGTLRVLRSIERCGYADCRKGLACDPGGTVAQVRSGPVRSGPEDSGGVRSAGAVRGLMPEHVSHLRDAGGGPVVDGWQLPEFTLKGWRLADSVTARTQGCPDCGSAVQLLAGGLGLRCPHCEWLWGVGRPPELTREEALADTTLAANLTSDADSIKAAQAARDKWQRREGAIMVGRLTVGIGAVVLGLLGLLRLVRSRRRG